jgi:predicted dehydrogenase
MDRRTFIKHMGIAASVASAGPSINAAGANERVNIAFMGCGGRGQFLLGEYAKRDDVHISWLADCDLNRAGSAAKKLAAITDTPAKVDQDFRHMLDDPEVDGIVGALPDHWHALGTIMACQAGKDMYVEKPTAHSIWESQKMIEAARKYDRVVQVGAQNRSNEYCQAAYDHIRSEAFGEVHYARVINSKNRSPIGREPDEAVPDGVDYDMWLGPAQDRPFNKNRFHYTWHWMWEFSGGDIINDGVHQIDVARWMIDKEYPKAVSSGGGMHFFDDAQEAPDTQNVIWDYDGLTMVFEQTLWTPYMKKTAMSVRDTDTLPSWPFSGTRIEIYGSKQIMFFSRHGGGWQCFDADGNSAKIYHGRFSPSNTAHIENYLDCIRTRKRPNGDIEKLHKSTLLCLYGNVAFRTGKRLEIDPTTEAFTDDEANTYVKRQYREPWIVPDEV